METVIRYCFYCPWAWDETMGNDKKENWNSLTGPRHEYVSFSGVREYSDTILWQSPIFTYYSFVAVSVVVVVVYGGAVAVFVVGLILLRIQYFIERPNSECAQHIKCIVSMSVTQFW